MGHVYNCRETIWRLAMWHMGPIKIIVGIKIIMSMSLTRSKMPKRTLILHRESVFLPDRILTEEFYQENPLDHIKFTTFILKPYVLPIIVTWLQSYYIFFMIKI